jgi:hypothetical protein
MEKEANPSNSFIFLKSLWAHFSCRKTVLWMRIRIDFGRPDPDSGG